MSSKPISVRRLATALVLIAVVGLIVIPAQARSLGKRGPVERQDAAIASADDSGLAPGVDNQDPIRAAAVPSGPVEVAINLAVDGIDVPAAERRLLVTALLTNAGGGVELALCPALFLGGTVRPIQGYSFVAGAPNADCTVDVIERSPTLGLSIDALPAGAPTCPAPAPTTPSGDKVVVPAAGMDPGVLVLQYEYLLVDLGDGVENEEPGEILKRVREGDGVLLNTLTGIDPGLAALVCPAGVDTMLAAAPDPEIATIDSVWLHVPVPASGDVSGTSVLYSPASFGAEEETVAVVKVEWSDNLPVPLEDFFTHEPEPGVEFTIAPGDLALGKLSATFPDDLSEGFRGEAVVRVYRVVREEGETDQTEELLSVSRHPFVVDASAPEVLAATTVRSASDVAVGVEVADATSGIGSVRQFANVAGTDLPSELMVYQSGDFEQSAAYAGLVDPVTDRDVVGVRVQADDASGNDGEVTLPVAGAGPDDTFECNSEGGADVTLDGSLSTIPPDSESATTTFVWTSDAFDEPLEGEMVDAFLPLDEYTDVLLTLTDERGFTGTDSATYFVEDTLPPIIEDIDLSRDCLWPPNHKYVRFVLDEDIFVTAYDQYMCDPELDVRIVHVESNQKDNGRGDGNTVHDAVYSDEVFCVRSERTGRYKGDRVYTVTIEVSDDSGNATQSTVSVRVPHDQRAHDCPKLSSWEFSGKHQCDLERIGQSTEAGEMLRRGKPARDDGSSPVRTIDRSGRGRR